MKRLKSKYFWMAVYVLFTGLTFWYVSSVLNKDSLNVSEEQQQKKAVEIKPIKATLIVETSPTVKSYTAKKTNTDSVLDLLNTLQKTTDFKYQVTSYVDRVEIDFVNGAYPPAGYKWKIFFKGDDITQTFHDIYLENNGVYTIRWIKG